MLSTLWNLASFLVALGILIAVHEFGHFWVARRCGVQVDRFSIGFGKVLLRRQDKQGTEYVLSIIPLGGYVKMLDERAGSVTPELRHRAFNNKTVWQRAAIVSAGPIANFIFAIFAYWAIFMMGVPSVKPVVSSIMPNSIAAKAEIQPGTELKSIDGIEMADWDSVRLTLLGLIGKDSAEIGVAPFGTQSVTLKKVDLKDWQYEPDKQDPVVSLGIIPKGPQIEPILAEVQKDSAAQKAGMQVGDRIINVDGKPLDRWMLFVQTVRNNPGTAVVLDIERNGSPLSLTLIPDTKQIGKGATEGFAGVVPKIIPLSDEYKVIRQYGPFTALYESAGQTWQLMKLTAKMLGKLITGDVKLNTLSGPISIAQGAGASAGYGVVPFLIFLALISVNLGIINLFPLPVLDGGHLLFLLIEKIKGTPVSEQVQEYFYRIGAMLLVVLMGLALFNDFSRL